MIYAKVVQPRVHLSESLLTHVVGLNVVRMNFSHGSYEYHQSVIDNAKNAEKQYPGRPLAIALDTVSWDTT